MEQLSYFVSFLSSIRVSGVLIPKGHSNEVILCRNFFVNMSEIKLVNLLLIYESFLVSLHFSLIKKIFYILELEVETFYYYRTYQPLKSTYLTDKCRNVSETI